MSRLLVYVLLLSFITMSLAEICSHCQGNCDMYDRDCHDEFNACIRDCMREWYRYLSL